MQPLYYNQIQGWMTFWAFYTQMYNSAPENAHFVEVGAWLGKSTCYMAELIKAGNKFIQFDVVDTWKGASSEPYQLEIVKQHNGDIFEAFMENMRKAGVEYFVKPVQLDSVEASKLYKDNSLDFVFIDGDHYNDAVLKDLNAWYKKVKTGGIIAGHDSDFEPVRKNVIEFFNGQFEESAPESVWYVVKK